MASLETLTQLANAIRLAQTVSTPPVLEVDGKRYLLVPLDKNLSLDQTPIAHSNAADPATVLAAVASYFGMDVSRIKGRSQNAHSVKVRAYVVYILSKYLEMPGTEISRCLGKDHTTVYASLERMKTRYCTERDFERNMAALCKQLALK